MVETHFSTHEIPRQVGVINVAGAKEIYTREQYLTELEEQLSWLREEMLSDWIAEVET